VDYSKWDQLNFSSDEDDCHPNIEINTWRRLKERYRKEHGLTKREPKLVDKWSSTIVNKEQYDLMNVGSKNDKENENKSEKTDDNVENKNEKIDANVGNENEQNIAVNNNNNNDNDNKENKPETTSNENISNLPTKANDDKNNTQPQSKTTTSASASTSSSQTTNQNQKSKKNDDEHYYARSDPSTFLKEHMKEIKHFASIKNQKKADKYLIDNYELVHEATEGYLITHAVDRAVEGCDEKEKERLAFRCLQIHNLVQSCSTANVGPQKRCRSILFSIICSSNTTTICY